MKVYKLTVMVIDFDNLQGDGIQDLIQNTKYPNYCINPNVMDIKSVDIGEWEDSNPLNMKNTQEEEFKRLFPS